MMRRAAFLLLLPLAGAAWAQTSPPPFSMLPEEALVAPPFAVGEPDGAGPAVDAQGREAPDPTKNVLDLVAAESRRVTGEILAVKELFGEVVKRLDQLREAEQLRTAERTQAAVVRSNDLRDSAKEANAAAVRFLEREAELRAAYNSQIQATETARVNAVRDVDAASTISDREAAREQAQVIAAQVTTTRDSLADQVDRTAAVLLENLTRLESSLRTNIGDIADRLSVVEQAQFRGEGRQLVADPALTALAAEVRALANAQESGAGRDSGISATWAAIAGLVALMLTLIGVAVAVVSATRRDPPP